GRCWAGRRRSVPPLPRPAPRPPWSGWTPRRARCPRWPPCAGSWAATPPTVRPGGAGRCRAGHVRRGVGRTSSWQQGSHAAMIEVKQVQVNYQMLLLMSQASLDPPPPAATAHRAADGGSGRTLRPACPRDPAMAARACCGAAPSAGPGQAAPRGREGLQSVSWLLSCNRLHPRRIASLVGRPVDDRDPRKPARPAARGIQARPSTPGFTNLSAAGLGIVAASRIVPGRSWGPARGATQPRLVGAAGHSGEAALSDRFTRREVLRAATAGAVGLATPALAASPATAGQPLKGNLRHSVARWTFARMPIDALCRRVRQIGFAAIDLVGPDDWPVLKAHGVDSSMCNGAELGLEKGFADTRFHDELVARYTRHIDLVADAGYRNLICFSGNRAGMDPDEGMANAAAGLK